MATCHRCEGPGGPCMSADGYRIERCRSCGLVFAAAWSKSFDHGFYDYYRRRLDWSFDEVYLPLNVTSAQQTIERLERLVDGKRLLDVGCGEGLYVLAATRRGWSATGIDLAEPAIAVARRHGVNCETRDFFDETLSAERFDVVVMSELIEHVPKPQRFLTRARELLAPGGTVYVTTPNFDSIGRRVLSAEWNVIGPGHISYFTPATLRSIAAEAGLHADMVSTKSVSGQTVKRLLRRREMQPGSGVAVSTEYAETQGLRERIDRSRALQAAQFLVNAGLRVTGLGEQMVARLVHPR